MFEYRRCVFSKNGKFRYVLEQILTPPSLLEIINSGHAKRGPTILVCMVNPSKAGMNVNDHTVTKIFGFGSRYGWYRVRIWNLYAFRATDIKDLRAHNSPIGKDNDKWLQRLIPKADQVIVAWGNVSKMPPDSLERIQVVENMAQRFNKQLWCWGINTDGQPIHPLTIGYDRTLIPWPPEQGLFYGLST